MKRLFFLFLLVLVVVAGWYRGLKFIEDAQRGTETKKTPEMSVELKDVFPTAPPLSLEWKPLKPGIQIKHIPYTYSNTQYGIQVLQLDPAHVTFSLEYDPAGKTIGQWAQAKPDAIVTNSGFFKEENKPVGLLYIKGSRLDSHRINQKGTGLLTLEKKGVKIRDLGSSPVEEGETFQNALQSFPLLISDGKVQVFSEATTQDRRTAIGIDKDGLVYLISVEYAHLGLFDFANLLYKSDIKFTKVLNLDGGGSTGVAVPFNHEKPLINSQTTVPTVLVIDLI